MFFGRATGDEVVIAFLLSVLMRCRIRFLLGILAASFGLSGCAWLTQPPREAEARQRESMQAREERKFAAESAVTARASQYERQGMDPREARAAAEIEYAKSGRKP